MSIRVGETVCREPYWMRENAFPFKLRHPCNGTITYINHRTLYYLVEFENGLRECYKIRDSRRLPPPIEPKGPGRFAGHNKAHVDDGRSSP